MTRAAEESPTARPAGGAAPLRGRLVVDLSRHLPGPLAARLLCDLGARVVKVEQPPAGDPVRLSAEVLPGSGALPDLLLAGIESVALDLKREPHRKVLRKLLQRADVLLESFRPGTLARLGLDPHELQATLPRLILCSLSGWGQRGPGAWRAGHDLTYQARAGALASTLTVPPLPAADLLGAWSAVAAILARLVERQRSGHGGWIDAALLDAAVHGNLTALAAEAESPRPAGERLPLSGAMPCYGVYSCADGGRVALAALEPEAWQRFCDAVERPDLVPLQRQASPAAADAVAAVFASRSRKRWAELFDRLDLPAEPVLSVAEARADPQLAGRGLLPDETLRPGFPALLDGSRPRAGGAPPKVGEHTARWLAELGFDAAALARPAGSGEAAGE